MNLSDEITMLFKKDRKCIINADLDGLLSGLILNKFLNWEIVGFSSCSGKSSDELWLCDPNEDISECIFVDLPVYLKSYSTIDQHFVAFDKESVENYKNHKNKINPNIMRERVLKTETDTSEYTMKYPFGTVHFIIAILENMKIIDENYKFPLDKELDDFLLADLILRADRVVQNTAMYTKNCIDWSNWLVNIGGANIKELFRKVFKDINLRLAKEKKVEYIVRTLGCMGADGDCSNMLRSKDYDKLNNYLHYLSSFLGTNDIKIHELTDFGKLNGKRIEINSKNFNILKDETLKDNVFSFAFVTMKYLSITYIKGDE